MYDRRGSSITAFILGGVVGAVVGMLYAPRPGVETRAAVSDKVNEYWGEGREFYETGRTRVTEIASNVKPVVAEKTDAVKSKIEDARERLAEQVAKSASTARSAVQSAVPAVIEGVDRAAEVASHGVHTAGEKVLSKLDGAPEDVADVVEAAADAVPEV